MNYYEARELRDEKGEGTGRWHYTVRNDGRIWPVGYCADGCPGHESAEAACEHQREYELANLRQITYAGWTDCQVCGAPTKAGVEHGPGIGHPIALCDEHRTPEVIDGLVVVGQVISS